MQSPIGSQMMAADVYTDLQGLSKISQKSRGSDSDKAEALTAVAKQFESVFLNMMMKAMREANEAFKDESMSGSNEMNFYQQMFDQQLTLSLSKQGMGLSDALVRQLQSQMGSNTEVAQGAMSIMPKSASIKDDPYVQSLYSNIVSSKEKASAPAQSIEAVSFYGLDGTPETFKKALWPLATAAAEQLGVDPRYLVSQAALETGWGKHMITDQAGNNSFNLFGIKASANWDGETAAVKTLEYRDGIAQQETAKFRVYNSLAQSFQDYVNFVSTQERYQPALQHQQHAQQSTQQSLQKQSQDYVQALQSAGYATDPQYAEKIEAIVQQHFPDRG